MNKVIYTETILIAEEIAASASTPNSGPSPSSLTASQMQTLEEKWENAGIGNAFIFGKVMSNNTDLLLELLQLSLPELEIKEISNAVQEFYMKTSIEAHGVRLDISVRDSKNHIFDVEMQLRDEKNIPHRICYYTGTLDQTNLKSGEDYKSSKTPSSSLSPLLIPLAETATAILSATPVWKKRRIYLNWATEPPRSS